MTHARRYARPARLRATSRSASRKTTRKHLLAERLEERSLLAADVTAFHNWLRPTDVNADGSVSPLDALVIVNGLNAGYAGVLTPQAAGAQGESGSQGLPQGLFYDVNNDGFLSPLDALLIFNELNAEGELQTGDIVQYEIRLLQPGTNTLISGLTDPNNPTTGITGTVSIGQEFDLQIRVRDLRTGTGPRGGFAAFTDILITNPALASVRVPEVQTIRVNDASIPSMTLTIPFSGGSQTTASIALQDQDGIPLSTSIVAADIKAKLEALAGVGANNVLVDLAAPARDPQVTAWDVRFVGALYDTNLPLMTSTPGTGIVITEINPNDPRAFTEAFRSVAIPGNAATGTAYQNSLSAALAPDRFDEVGAVAGQAPQGTAFREVVRVRMRAGNTAGTITFTPDFADQVRPAHDTLVYTPPTGEEPVALGFASKISATVTSAASATTFTAAGLIGSATPPVVGDGVIFTSGALNTQFRLITAYDPATGEITVDSPFSELPAEGDAFTVRELIDRVGSQPNGVSLTIVTGPIDAVDDADTTNEDTPKVIDVLANDTTIPATGQTKNVIAVTQPANGSVSFTTANVTFTPAANFNGVTSFTYTARNITAGANSAPDTATVTVTVNAVNDAPTLNAINNQNVNEGGGTVTVNLSGITPGGGPDEAGQVLAVTATSSNPAVVTTSVNYTPSDPTGSLVLTGGTAGTATVTVTVTDNGSNTPPNVNNVSRTFVVTVAAVNDPPVNSVPGAQQINTGQTLAFSTANGNAITISDPDAGTANVSVTLTVPPGDGVLNVAVGTPPTITGNGTNNLVLTGTIAQINAKLNTLVFTPTGNLNTNGGNTTLTVLTNDQGNTGVGGPQTDTDQIPISVRPPVPPPQADNDSFNATEDTVLNVPAPGVLDGDTDPENRGPLTAVAATVTISGGVVVLANDGSFVYTPTANFNGNTSFTYRARAADGTLSAPATVTISVAAVNDAPDAVNDDFLAVKLLDPSFADQVVPVLANDTDVDGDSLTVTALNGQPGPITTGAGATVRISASGQVLYTPAAGFTGNDSFTYTISDGNGGTDTATVNVQVVDFVPKDVSGTVYMDTNNNGVVDPNETRLAGVTVVLTGTDFGGTPVNLTRTTDVNGAYTFAGLRPGNYTLVQSPIPFLIDGLESENSPLVELTTLNNVVVNDSFSMSWGATDRSGPITSLNFGERGVNVADPSLTNTAGLMQEMFSTSSRDGYILAANAQGRSIWGWALNNWGNFTVEVFINPSDLSTAVLRLNGTTQIRIYQDPARNGTNTIDGLPTPPQGSMARFRILAYGTEGRHIIRLDGKLSDFLGQQQIAANQQPQAEGEGAQFAAGADAVFGSEQGWA